MNIYWRGGNCIKIESQNSALILNPVSAPNGVKSIKLDADVVVFASKEEKEKLVSAKDAFFSIYNPGEYDVKGFFIFGWGGFNGSIAYTIETEGIRLAYVSSAKELNEAQLENLNSVDILIIDVGSSEETNETASKIVGQIEPRVVVPVGYEAAQKPMVFLKEMGASETEAQNKLNIKKKDLPQEETEVYLLNLVK